MIVNIGSRGLFQLRNIPVVSHAHPAEEKDCPGNDGAEEGYDREK